MLQAQNSIPPLVAKHGYADSIVVNGRIVSMDDQGYNTNPGRIYEAMAVKGTRIMALGTNQEIRTLANQDTKVMDVGGRVVLPGIIDVHSHLFFNSGIANSMGIQPSSNVRTLTVRAGKDIESTRLVIEQGIQGELRRCNRETGWSSVSVRMPKRVSVDLGSFSGPSEGSWKTSTASPAWPRPTQFN
jgi:hypothetical protein